MPIYDFICNSCNSHFDALTSYNWHAAGICCPVCGSGDLEKAVSRLGGFQSGGKIQMLDSKPECTSCHSGACSTCH
jgi:putative FmdB family regulatory protein